MAGYGKQKDKGDYNFMFLFYEREKIEYTKRDRMFNPDFILFNFQYKN